MIHVDRSTVPIPEVLTIKRAKDARAGRAARSQTSQRLQERFEFDAEVWLSASVNGEAPPHIEALRNALDLLDEKRGQP